MGSRSFSIYYIRFYLLHSFSFVFPLEPVILQVIFGICMPGIVFGCGQLALYGNGRRGGGRRPSHVDGYCWNDMSSIWFLRYLSIMPSLDVVICTAKRRS